MHLEKLLRTDSGRLSSPDDIYIYQFTPRAQFYRILQIWRGSPSEVCSPWFRGTRLHLETLSPYVLLNAPRINEELLRIPPFSAVLVLPFGSQNGIGYSVVCDAGHGSSEPSSMM